VSGVVFTELAEKADEAIQTAVTQGTLAILDERAFERFARDLTTSVARQAALTLDTDDMLAIIAEEGLLEPGRKPLVTDWVTPGSGFDFIEHKSSLTTSQRQLSFRGQMQKRAAEALETVLQRRLQRMYAEIRT
jgi:hypothetical protein